MVNMENYEEYMMMEADGELNAEEQQALYAFLEEHPELMKELNAFKAAHLPVDEELTYQFKDQLLKEELKREGNKPNIIPFGPRSWMTYGALAAGLALLVVTIIKRQPNETARSVVTVQPGTTTIKDTLVSKTNAVPQELHSTPKNPVAYEAKQNPASQHIVPVKKTSPTIAPSPTPIVNPNNIAIEKHEQRAPQSPIIEKTKNIIPEIKPDSPLPQKTIAEVNTPENKPAAEMANAEKENNKLIAYLPMKDGQKEALGEIADAMEAKIEKVKNLKSQLKDSDISFKIGKKELFVVRL